MVSSIVVPFQGVSEIAKKTIARGTDRVRAPCRRSTQAADEGAPRASDRNARTGGLRDNPGQLLLTLACLVIVVFGMRYAAGVLNPILVALFVVMGLSPVLDWMRRKKVPSWLTITIVLVVVLGHRCRPWRHPGLVRRASSAIGIDVYKDRLSRLIADIQGGSADTASTPVPSSTSRQRRHIANSVSSLLGSVVDAFTNVVLMVMIVLFMLAQVYSFPRKVYSRFDLSERFERSFRSSARSLRSYLFTKGWLALIAAVISTGIYYAFGVDFALLWGIVFFVLSFIPNSDSSIS